MHLYRAIFQDRPNLVLQIFVPPQQQNCIAAQPQDFPDPAARPAAAEQVLAALLLACAAPPPSPCPSPAPSTRRHS